MFVEVTVDQVRVNMSNFEWVVVLKAKSVSKYLLILIGPNEANSIALKLQGQELPRPMTHDLMDSVIRDLGAKIIHVVVSEVREKMFLAKIVLQKNGTTVESDSRPSDAIALAVRSGAPIYAEEDVLEQAGIDFNPETGEPTSANPQWPTVSIVEMGVLFSERVQRVLRRASEEARRLGHEKVEPEDIFLALVSEAEGVGAKVLTYVGVDLEAIQSRLQDETARGESRSN